jgi:hypothetical protein
MKVARYQPGRGRALGAFRLAGKARGGAAPFWIRTARIHEMGTAATTERLVEAITPHAAVERKD